MTLLKDRHLAENVVADPANPAAFTMTVHGEQGTVDVTNAFGYINANPDEDANALVERFVRSITYDPNKPVAEGDIVAVIRTRDYVDAMAPDILREPLGADLTIVYMADEPDAIKSLTSKDLPGRSLSSLRKVALDNIRKWLPKVVADNGLGDGVLYFVDDNTMLSPSLMLVDEFWTSVAGRFPGDVLIALPRKDQLILFDDTPNARAGVRRLIAATVEENFNLLSPQLYARRGGKIVAVSD